MKKNMKETVLNLFLLCAVMFTLAFAVSVLWCVCSENQSASNSLNEYAYTAKSDALCADTACISYEILHNVETNANLAYGIKYAQCADTAGSYSDVLSNAGTYADVDNGNNSESDGEEQDDTKVDPNAQKLEELNSLSYKEKVMLSLNLAWKGMLVIFVAIAFIFLIIKLCGIRKKNNNRE
ncbi:MAG: hypothetical protein PHX51_08150 [Clostridia bacterium]|nr:hypothetical protein [Clostridia bacterium]